MTFRLLRYFISVELFWKVWFKPETGYVGGAHNDVKFFRAGPLHVVWFNEFRRVRVRR